MTLSDPPSKPPSAQALFARLWHAHLARKWPKLALILALVVLIAGATSLYPVLIKLAFDVFAGTQGASEASALLRGLDGFLTGLTGSKVGVINVIALLVVIITSIKGFSLLGQTVLTNSLVTKVEADMQGALYAHLIDADLAQVQRESPATLTQRFTTDFAFIKEALTRLVNIAIRDVVTAIALVGTMAWIDWQMTLIVMLIAPIVAQPLGRIGKKLRRVATSQQEQTGLMAGLVAESLAGARPAKTDRLEAYLKARATAAFEEIRKLKMKAANARGRLDPLLEIGGGIAVAAVLATVAFRISSGQRTVGDFTGYVTALLLAAQPLRSLGNLNAIVQEAGAALQRYYATLDEQPRIVDAPGARPLAIGRGEVAFRDVAFRYRDDQRALEGMSLRAAGGAMTALVGRSGSGKSTLLALVPRLYDVDSGAVEIDGQDVRAVTLASLREHVAVVSQDVILFDDTIEANIRFGRPSASRAEIEAAAEAAAADRFIKALPDGYATRVGDRGSKLSGGERQRVALARAILKDAPILLLDEATSALDAESERLVQEALARLMKGRTTLVIAHRLSTVREADLIAVMEEGRVIEQGTHDELIARDGAYARLHRLQLSDA